jgi:hypothetical protein
MGILEIVAVLAALFLFAVAMATFKSKDRAMAMLVGASAGLVGVQVMRVHVFTILVVIWCLFSNGNVNRGSGKRIAGLAGCSTLLAITEIYGDLVVSPTLALQLLAFTLSGCMIIAKASARDREDMLYGLLALATLSSVVGVLQVIKIVPIEIWHAHVSSVGRPIGIYPEPDWLGMFAGLGLIAGWRLPMPAAIRTICISANAAAFIFAFARAAWVGVGASVALVIVAALLTRRRTADQRDKRRGKFPAVALVLGAAAAFVAINPHFVDDFARRLQNTLSVGSTDISGQARVRQIDGLLEMARTAPWYGHGLSANGRVGIWGSYNSGDAADTTNAVNSNWLLAMWVDGKILALPLIALLIVLAVITCRTVAGQLLLVVLLNSLFSNATFQPIMWLLVALALSTAWDRVAAPALYTPIENPSHSLPQAPLLLEQQ